MKSMDKLILLDIALSFNTTCRLKEWKQQILWATNAGTEIDLARVRNKSMPYKTKTHSCIVSLINRLLLGKFPKYLLIIQAVELICQTNRDAAVFEMHHNDFFAKTFHSGVEFYFCGGDRELKQGCKNSYYKVIDALLLGKVFDHINSYCRQTSSQGVFICKDNGRCGEGNNQRSSCMMKCLIITFRSMSDSPHVYLKLW